MLIENDVNASIESSATKTVLKLDMSTVSAAIHNALLKVETVLQKSERQIINPNYQKSDFSVYVSFILENTVLLDQLSRIYLNSDTTAKSLPVDDRTVTRFLKILSRVAKGNEGVSRQERIFIYQFWSAFQKF